VRLLLPPRLAAAAVREDGAAGPGNIVGVGIGVKTTGGRAGGRPVVKVFVRHKLEARRVASSARVPRRLGGIATDVDECGEVRAHGLDAGMTARRPRPAGGAFLPGGLAVGRDGTERVGTLACLVKGERSPHVLGTNHILALVNRGPIGAPIRLRGRHGERDRRGGILGRLSRFVPIAFDADNEVDAAMARASPLLMRLLPENERLMAPPAPAPGLGMLVQRSSGRDGRASAPRCGRIDAIAVTVNVNFAPLGRVARFVNQFRVRGTGGVFSDRGDSGALVTARPGNRPVGLLFAGSAAANMSFCNDIATVCRRLGVAIVS
jgi:hypothetical protein